MSAASIRASIKKGLAKAAKATGSASSEVIYLVKSVTTGSSLVTGGGTTTVTTTELKSAMFKSYDAKLFDGTMLAGDRALTCDNEVVIKQGDQVKQGSTYYVVIALDIKAPTSDVLAYILHLRLK